MQPHFTLAKYKEITVETFDVTDEEYFDFLENLRKSGKTNMFGAVPYIVEAFEVTNVEAKAILMRWIEQHK